MTSPDAPFLRCWTRLLPAITLLLLGVAPTLGQPTCSQRLEQAQEAYSIGRFDLLSELLTPCTEAKETVSIQAEAHALLAKAAVAQDDLETADHHIQVLVQLRPGYEPRTSDPLEYQRRVRQAKHGSLEVRITSVSKKAESLREAPATVVVITAAEIERRGYSDLEAVLHDIPGFDISRSNGLLYSHMYQRGYRSINTNRTLLLIDGVEQNDLWSSNLYLSRQFPLSNIAVIEVIYGPASTMYGANAFVGVINVITKSPGDLIAAGKSTGALVEAGYGSWDTRLLEFSVAGRWETAGISYSLTGRGYQSDEFDVTGYSDWDFRLEDLPFYVDILTIEGEDAVSAFLEEYCSADCDPYEHPLFRLVEDEAGVRIVPTPIGAARARELDAIALDEEVLGSPVSMSDRSDDWYVYGKLQSGFLTLGVETWRREEGPGSWFSDERFAGYHNGTMWVPRQTFLYAKYERPLIGNELLMSFFARYKSHELDQDTALTGLSGYRNGRRDLGDLLTNRPSVWSTTYFHQISKQLRAELKAVYVPNSKFDLVSGLEFRSGEIQGDRSLSSVPNPQENGFPGSTIPEGATIQGKNSFDVQDVGLYAQASYRPREEWKLVLGGRVDNNRIDSTGGYGTVLNPRVAAIYTPGPFTFKVIYATAFKDASNRDKYSAIPGFRIPNPTLEPERVDDLELGFGWEVSERLRLDLTAFDASYSDVLASVPVTLEDGSVVNQNQAVGELSIRGAQANLRYRWGDVGDVYANYTFTDPENTETGERIGDIASHQVNAGIDLGFRDRYEASLRMSYSGVRDTGAGTTVSTNPLDEIDAYFVVNGAFGYETGVDGLKLQLAVGNIFGREYYHPGIRTATNPFAARLIQPTRSFLLKARYRF